MKRRIIPAVALLFLAMNSGAWAGPVEDFKKGNALFAAEKYAEALELYKSISIQNPDLEYNIGATYLKLDILGLATLHFKRAQRLRPDDEDTQANLRFIMARKTDREASTEHGMAYRAMEWVLTRGSVAGVTHVALGLYLATCAMATLLILLRPRRGKREIAFAMALLVGATVIFAALALARISRFEDRSQAVVMVAEAPVRQDPSSHADPVFILHEATVVSLGRVEGNYVFATLASGHSGWVDRGSLERI